MTFHKLDIQMFMGPISSGKELFCSVCVRVMTIKESVVIPALLHSADCVDSV